RTKPAQPKTRRATPPSDLVGEAGSRQVSSVPLPAAGLQPRLRKFWLCADDYGISPAVDRAIRDLIARGRLNATSVMVRAPSFSTAEAAALGGHRGEH